MKNIILPNDRQLEWYSRELSAFIHFGMNTFHDREWGDGTESPSEFNPTELDCRQWIRELKNAGFKIAILTAKHHDGFCLWPSAYTEHSVKNSPYKNGKGDIVREFTDACREFGMKAGIYLSPWDRHEETWGSEAYNDFYVGQLTELMSNYGEIYECWWDGAGSTEAVYDWTRWQATVRRLQPNAVIFGSLGASPDVRWVGNEKGIAGDPCWSTVNRSSLEKEITSELNSGVPEGDSFIPAEADVSVRPGWFYHSDQDEEVRPLSNLVTLWFNSVGRNAGLLLNFPPDKRGLFHEKDVAVLRQFGSFLKNAFANNYLLDAKRSDQKTDGGVEIAFELGSEKEANCVLLSENIALGQRVRSYKLFAECGGEWKLISECQCIGYKRAIYFDEPIKATKIRLLMTESVGEPQISLVGLYLIDRPKPEADPKKRGFIGRNLLSSSSAKIERLDGEIYMQLGGIRRFNTLKLLGEGIERVEVSVFNGSSFELHGEALGGESETYYFFGETVDWAYRLKAKIFASPEFDINTCTPKLYCMEE